MSKMKFKKGAASFYIVAFSTMILLIIAMSFAAIIISQVTRSSNSDLSQSAYDSAMAGVEDAKLAYYNYQDCLAKGYTKASGLNGDGEISCKEAIYLVEDSNSCDTVGYILGRISDTGGEGSEVQIKESNDKANNMQQAYTCVKMETTLDSYEANLTASNPARVVNAKFDGIDASQINEIEISWYSDRDAVAYGSTINSLINSSGNLQFRQFTYAAKPLPPAISIGLVQTSGGLGFSFSDFDSTKGDNTNRGTIYLVPTSNVNLANKNTDSYSGIYNGTINQLNETGFRKSNDKTTKNLPYAVYCQSGKSYYCSALIKIPEPIGGARSNDNFMFVVASPYGQPMEFSLRFFCKSGASCSTTTVSSADGGTTVSRTTAALKGVQVGVDSTGRANDLYRRVEARMDVSGGGSGGSSSMSSILGVLELTGTSSGSGSGGASSSLSLDKNYAVICEWNFPNRGC